MHAVILAAGRGTRMQGLTAYTPKPLLEVSGKSLLVHKLEALPPEVTEVIIVIGYQGEQITAALGDSHAGRPIRYVVQEELNGTAGALWLCAPYLTGRFIVMMGDDLYAREDIERTIASPDWAALVAVTNHMGMGGRMVVDEHDFITEMEEGDHRGTQGLMNTNLLALDARVFSYSLIPKAPGSHEYGLPHTVLAAAHAWHIPMHAVYASGWFQITAPEDLARAEIMLSSAVPTGSA